MNSRIRDAAGAILIVCAVLAAYWPAIPGGLVWDDDSHITRPDMQSGEGLWRTWFDLDATHQYYPLLHTAFWIEHRLWGDSVSGYHLTNLLLHAFSACLVVWIVRRLSLPGAWLAGLLFALHPVSVEAVAWISEQKSTLSTVFYLASAYVYLGFDETRRKSRYGIASALFLCALASKTVTATLPAALLVILWWKRGRLDRRRDVAPLLPWLVTGAAAGLFTAWVERTYVGAEGARFDLGLIQRFLVAGRVIWFYPGKLLWPSNLNFNYPRWNPNAAVWWQYLFPLAALALAGGLGMLSRRRNTPGFRGPLAALLFFAGTLFPVLGFLNVYPFVYSFVADHFQYVASLGVIVPVAAGLSMAATRIPLSARRPVSTLAGGLLLATLGTLTWRQSATYRNVETLYRATLARNPGSWMAHNNLGNYLLNVPGALPEALAHFETTLRLQPDSPEGHNNMGSALSRIPGREAQSIDEFETALRLRPNFPEAHNNLGRAFSKTPGRLPQAISEYQAALALKPDFADARTNLATALLEVPGRRSEAMAQLEEALRINPDLAQAHNDLGGALAEIPGRMPEAIAQFEAALGIDPRSVEAHNNLGSVLTNFPDRIGEAIGHFQTSLQLDPNSAEAHNGLGLAFAKNPARVQEAIAQYQAALRIKPNYAEAHNNLGIALAGIPGAMREAIDQFETALRIDPASAQAHLNLGSALQEIPGRKAEAIAQFKDAVRLKPDLPEAHYLLGIALAEAPGRASEAAAEFEAALRIRPDYAEAHDNLGLLYARMPGRLADALAHFEASLRIKPDPEVQQLVDRLRAGKR